MKPDYLIWYIGNNDDHNRTRAEILVKLLKLDNFINEQHENCATFLSITILRLDSAKAAQLIKNLGNFMIRYNISAVDHQKITQKKQLGVIKKYVIAQTINKFFTSY